MYFDFSGAFDPSQKIHVLFFKSFMCVVLLASKLEHFQNGIHFRRDI